jgi:6-phosphogluconolactonase/glucosamine-6-phosphate isomerase/deaminase
MMGYKGEYAMLKIYKKEEVIAQEFAKEMKVQLQTENNPVFCLASGSMPQKS